MERYRHLLKELRAERITIIRIDDAKHEWRHGIRLRSPAGNVDETEMQRSVE